MRAHLTAPRAGGSVSASVVTIARGRASHLRQLLAGVARQATPVSEVVVVRMGGPSLAAVTDGAVPRPVSIGLDVGPDEPLPLSAARNRGAGVATGDVIVFLDVDCIPGAGVVGSLADRVGRGGVVASAQVQYLPPGVPGEGDGEGVLQRSGRFHPVRPEVVSDLRMVPELFWSLAFAIARPDFAALGGFDEGYRGYGGEDTDFGLRADAAGLEMVMVASARAYHQHHASHDPPLPHFDQLVTNARHFHQRWGRWPMEGWLSEMAELGMLSWSSTGTELEVLRCPTSAEIEAARVDGLFV